MTSFDLSMLVPWGMFLYIFWQMNFLPQRLILWGAVVSRLTLLVSDAKISYFFPTQQIFATIDLLWYCKTVCLDICNGCGWYLFKINKVSSFLRLILGNTERLTNGPNYFAFSSKAKMVLSHRHHRHLRLQQVQVNTECKQEDEDNFIIEDLSC